MTQAARLSALRFVAAALVFVAGYAVIPARVTFGAGSLRCGTSLHPTVDDEVGNVCPAIGRQRLKETAIATAVFSLVAAALIPFRRWIEGHEAVRSLITVVVLVFWLVGGALTLFTLTGAYSSPGT